MVVLHGSSSMHVARCAHGQGPSMVDSDGSKSNAMSSVHSGRASRPAGQSFLVHSYPFISLFPASNIVLGLGVSSKFFTRDSCSVRAHIKMTATVIRPLNDFLLHLQIFRWILSSTATFMRSYPRIQGCKTKY